MEHVNNDMDDLFRKAGNLYPLKTSESDWDGVLGKLQEENFGDQTAMVGSNTPNFRNKRRWLSLLIFIPLGLGSVVYFSSSKKQTIPSTTPLSSGKNNVLHENKTNSRPIIIQRALTTNPEIKNEISRKNQSVNTSQGSPDYATRNPLYKNADLSKKGISHSVANNLAKADLFIGKPSDDPELFHEPLAKPVSLSATDFNEMISVYGKPFPSSVTETHPDLSQEGTSKSKSNKPLSSKGIYAGFIAGPDFSSVKLQSVNRTGLSLGLEAGYQFNKHFAVETGLIWDKKYYYSSGEYFNTSKISTINPNMKVLYVNGSCSMLEIPVNLRYGFAIGRTSGFFVKAGLSSYLMMKDKYDCQVVNTNTGQYYPYSNVKSENSNYIFSMMQMSAGYMYAISRNTNIQIEPYVKIPLQGIGIGSMPISSAGFYLGITHSFH